MIFLCFSGKDRYTIVQSILYHLKNYGLEIWFDNHEYILGDHKTRKYTQAIINSKYTIVILSKYFWNSEGAIEELEVIKKQFENNKIHIFPILYKIKACDVPKKFQWLTELIYNELDDSTGTILTCNQILCKVLKDYIDSNEYYSLEYFLKDDTFEYIFLKQIINSYNEIVEENHVCKITLLYTIYLYISEQIDIPKNIYKAINYIFKTTKLNINYNFKEIVIMEYLITICLNQLYHL